MISSCGATRRYRFIRWRKLERKKKKKSIFEEVQLRKKSIVPNDRMPKEYFGIFFFRSFCGKITTIILSRSEKRRNFFFYQTNGSIMKLDWVSSHRRVICSLSAVLVVVIVMGVCLFVVLNNKKL